MPVMNEATSTSAVRPTPAKTMKASPCCPVRRTASISPRCPRPRGGGHPTRARRAGQGPARRRGRHRPRDQRRRVRRRPGRLSPSWSIGHEGFGQVVEVGSAVTEVAPGDYVVATVRRPGSTLYDAIGTSDMTTDDTYYERGINLRHGYLTEYYVDDADFIVKIPQGLKEVAVLLEPVTVVEKGIAQAYEIQRRLRVWRPRRAAVVGAGTIGLLAALALRLRGLDVTVFALTPQAVPERGPDRGDRRPLRLDARPAADRGRRPARPVRPDLRGDRLRADRVRGHAGAGEERRAGAVQRHRRRSPGRSAGRQDQPGLRARQQGHGRHGQRQPRVLRDRREGHGTGRGAVPRAGWHACSPTRSRASRAIRS